MWSPSVCINSPRNRHGIPQRLPLRGDELTSQSGGSAAGARLLGAVSEAEGLMRRGGGGVVSAW